MIQKYQSHLITQTNLTCSTTGREYEAPKALLKSIMLHENIRM